MENKKLKVTFEKIEKIKEYKNNAKIHDKRQIEQIKKSILEFGFNDPLAIDENNVLIEGHGRLAALKQLDFKEVPVIKLSHLNDLQKKQYILAHNKLTMNTGFDENILRMELGEIREGGLDLEVLGFEDFEIEGIFKENDMDVEGFFEDSKGKQSENSSEEIEEKNNIYICEHCGKENTI